MKYLKSINEGFFKKKEREVIKDDTFALEFFEKHLEDVKDCFVEVASDMNYHLNVSVIDPPFTCPEINVELYPSRGFMKLSDMIETFRFASSYLPEIGLKISRYDLWISGKYDNINYMGDIYYDTIRELEQDLNKEGTKHIQGVVIKVVKIKEI